MTSNTSVTKENTRNKIHPHKFALWAACAGIVMMFASLTSAYLVRQAAGNWLEFRLPDIFFASTGAIIASSLTLHSAYLAFLRGHGRAYRILLAATMILGLAFLVLQYEGWLALMEIGVPLKTNPSGDFIYAISGLHAAHVLGGIGVLVVALLHAFLLDYQVTPARKLRFELTLTYWHFVDALWVYLLAFLIISA